MENLESKNVAKKSSKIPKAVPFILFNVLLERYSTTAISGEINFKFDDVNFNNLIYFPSGSSPLFTREIRLRSKHQHSNFSLKRAAFVLLSYFWRDNCRQLLGTL